jgi:hypothetical protein
MPQIVKDAIKNNMEEYEYLLQKSTAGQASWPEDFRPHSQTLFNMVSFIRYWHHNATTTLNSDAGFGLSQMFP